ncbi:hypothetical protein BD770DRAFT_438616 [Pilaira anomala]|nr:hypothetical protein BD770DRAFT_438616 [Pilaira anomala]
MAQLMNTSFEQSISQSFNEKFKKHSPSTEFPPTPSSSTLSFLVTDQKSIDEEEIVRLPLNTAINTTPPQFAIADYGSLSSDFTYSKATTPSIRSSAPSTVSPNDDDEGLYLLWTHQLLRERGYQPSSCKLTADEEDDDDNYSFDSSITDLSVSPLDRFTPSPVDNTRSINKSFISLYTPSWLTSCLPKC